MRIDFHSHIFTSEYAKHLKNRKKFPYLQEIGGIPTVVRSPTSHVQLSKAFFDPQIHLSDMDRHGIDVSVLSLPNPWVDIFDEEEAVRLASEINADIARMVDESRGRFAGLGVLPMKNTEASIAELRNVVRNLGLKGVIVGSNIDKEPLSTPRILPILREAEVLDVPVFVHPTTPFGAERLSKYNMMNVLGYLFDTTVNVVELIFDGVLEKAPNLRLILAHQGGATPYLLGRVDQAYRDYSECRANIAKLPRDYLSRIYFDTVSYDSASLRFALGLFGSDHFVFGTDYPFPLGGGRQDIPTNRSTVDILNLDEGERDRIYSANAKRLLRL